MGDIKSPLWKVSSEVRVPLEETYIHVVVTSLRLNCVTSGRETLSGAGCERTEGQKNGGNKGKVTWSRGCLNVLKTESGL